MLLARESSQFRILDFTLALPRYSAKAKVIEYAEDNRLDGLPTFVANFSDSLLSEYDLLLFATCKHETRASQSLQLSTGYLFISPLDLTRYQ